jgi:hypothetical protein
LVDARRALQELNGDYEGRTSEEVLDGISDLEPSDPDYEASLGELKAELADAGEFEDTRAELSRIVRKLRRETLFASKQPEISYFEAVKGQILTPEALAILHSNLGLPAPIR